MSPALESLVPARTKAVITHVFLSKTSFVAKRFDVL